LASAKAVEELLGDSFCAGRNTPEGKAGAAMARKLAMRPLRAASDVNRSGKDHDLSRILKPDYFFFIAYLCFAESINRLDKSL
jgi:hypothetical protein